jgi:DNA-binding XRE family transcriptional regulator
VSAQLSHELSELAKQLQALAERTGDLSKQADPDSDHDTPDDLPPGQRLVRARSRAKMTQQGLADVTGVSVNAIINFERGKSKPRISTLMRLAEAVNVPWELLDDQEEA